MSHGIITAPSVIALPAPATPIAIRPAHLGDLAFIDRLQKMHSKMVGWMPTKQLEGKIAAGHVLVAEEAGSGQRAAGSNSEEVGSRQRAVGSAEAHSQPTAYGLPPTAIGYAIARDQYFKRDDVGIIYQLNVLPNYQRGLIGAHLLKAVFDRAAYGCRLFCCWCAQDLAANRFWEAMGFVPLAFRTGGGGRRHVGTKAHRHEGEDRSASAAERQPSVPSCLNASVPAARIHIFWQKRIREGDEGPNATPWWFPCKTDSGAIREDRIVLPIPPGLRWSDEMPVILPQAQKSDVRDQTSEEALPDRRRSGSSSLTSDLRPLTSKAKRPPLNMSCGLRTVDEVAPAPRARAKREPRAKTKCDPKLIAAARELRDRWLEKVNAGVLLPAEAGKYELTRRIAASRAVSAPMLPEQGSIAA
jgi:hypothetical protein